MKFERYLLNEGFSVRDIFSGVPQQMMSKVKSNPALKNKLNKGITTLLKPTYFNAIPLDKIFGVLNKEGIVALQEDQTEWSGLLLGGSKETQLVTFHLGWKETKDENKRYQVIPNIALHLSYFKMPSGKYEVIAYVS